MAPSIPSLALAAILLSALLHAAWNALLKDASDKGAAAALLGLVSVGVAATAGLWVGRLDFAATAWEWVLPCAGIEVIYFATLALALERLPLGTAYGLSRGLGLLVVVPLSVVLFAEAFDPADVLGVLLLVAGLFALVRGAPSRSGVALAAVCGLAIALYPLLYKQALGSGIDPYSLFVASVGLSIPGQVAMLGRGAVTRLRTTARADGGRIVLGGVLCASSFLIFLTLLEGHGAGRLTALRNASVVFATLLSMLQGRERTRRDLLCAVGVSVGCVLVA